MYEHIADHFPSDFLFLKKSARIPEIALCTQVLSVFYRHCSTYKCKTDYLDEVEKVARDWSYYKLEVGDTDIAAYNAVPRGNNLRFTESGSQSLRNFPT